jgi:hypothetical protein
MMPATSLKQKKLMDAVAHNPAFAKKVGIPQSVGEDFSQASKGKKFKEGGVAMKKTMEGDKSDMAQDKAMIKKAFKQHDQQEHQDGVGTKLKLKKGGMTMAAFEKSGKDVEKKGMKEGSKADMALDKKQMMGMKKGGMSMAAFEKSGKDVEPKGMKEGSKREEAMDKKQMMGMAPGMKKGGMMKYAKGGMITTPMGSVTSGGKRPHGEHSIQTKGHTKGTNIKMRGA